MSISKPISRQLREITPNNQDQMLSLLVVPAITTATINIPSKVTVEIYEIQQYVEGEGSIYLFI